MIVDNVDDADSFLNAEDVACNAPFAYMPKCSHGSILYTTRDPQFAKQVSLSNDVVQVSNLTELESITLLNKIVSSHTNFESSDVLSSPDDLVLLSKELGHHPLAIAQAATYMNTFHLPVSEYLRYFEDQQTARRLLKFEAPDFTRDKGWESLYSTWKISFDRIQEKNTLAADVLALMSFLDPDAIPMFLLAREFTDKLSLSEAISTLRAMSLISPNNEGRTYAIHRLIQLFMQNWLESQGSRPRFLSMSLHLLARLFPADQYEGYDTSSVLLPHATKVLSLEGVSEDDSLTRAELLDKVSQYELRLGRLQDAEKFAREAFRIKSRLLGSTGREAASCQVHLARVLLALGKYREARESATESFKSFQAIDSRSADILSSMDSLAEVLRHQGEYGEAEQMHLKTLRLKEKVLGESHPDTLTSMANLASTYRNQGRWEEAEQLEVQVMERSKAKLGEDHPDTLMSMNNLASTYHNQGRWELAEQLFVQVMETSKTKLGADHPSTLTSMNNLASTYMNQGRWEEAEQLEVQVMETSKTKLGADHPSTLTSMGNLASTYRNQGRWEEAEQLEVQVMETSKTKLGADHPLTLTSMANLAYTLRSSGQRKAALLLMGECVSLCDRKLGPDHPHTMSFKSALNEWRGNGESPSFELIKAPTETKDHQILASPTEASEPVSKPDRHGRRKLFSRLFSRK
jgi:tetratricopeptide (TPR) repeat protein